MTVYNINKGIGWASSGVEYAQVYRAAIFRKLNLDAKFIFTDMFQNENIAHFTANIGFENHEVIWLYSYFTDVETHETTYSLEELLATLPKNIVLESQSPTALRYRIENKDAAILIFFKKDCPTIVQRVEYLSKGKLIRKDYYSYTKVFSEYYVPENDSPKLYRRVFFHQDGSIAYEELVQGQKSLFRFSDAILYSKEELIARMLDSLKLTKKDIILLDRATGIGQAVMRHKGDAKLGVVVHAEHYSIGNTTDQAILWNNFYDYQFTQASEVDAFITSTDAQTETLSRQFKHYYGIEPNVVTLPVGSLDQLMESEKGRKAFSTLTCSRLASEKHIDWLIEGVTLARKELPQLTFDIYGEGGQRGPLAKLIEEKHATDYIRLMGHQDLTTIYQDYEVYLTASTSEGFGLTLMEAVGSGLAMIGLDVPYGNQTFIMDGKNGYLIPRVQPDNPITYAEAFARELVRLYQGELSTYHNISYEVAEEFLTTRLEEKWLSFIKEITQ
ncbi:TPA: accessory Sec system glycosyltransferase GtfA [Streptococcus suis]